MKKIVAIFMFCIAFTAIAQNPLDKQVGDFDEVKVFDLIEVNLIKDSNTKVVITGDDVDDVEVVNKNGKLKIRMNFNKQFNGQKTFVAVHYTKLSVIDGNEGAFITANELIEQDYIELKAQEGAHLKIGLDVEKLNVKTVSGGIVETLGKATFQDITLNTGGIYEGKTFETTQTTVSIKAGGDAKVRASNIVDAKVRAGGNVKIYGNPKTVIENIALGGTVTQIKD